MLIKGNHPQMCENGTNIKNFIGQIATNQLKEVNRFSTNN